MIQYFSPIFWNLLLFWSRGKIDKGILKRLERVANSPSSSSLKNTFKEAPKLSGTGTSLSDEDLPWNPWRIPWDWKGTGTFKFHSLFTTFSIAITCGESENCPNVPTGLLPKKKSGALRPHHKDMSQSILPKYLEKKTMFSESLPSLASLLSS